MAGWFGRGLVVVHCGILGACGVSGHPADDLLRFQHLQAKGTHNSYHIQPDPLLVDDWRYTHLSLDQQAELQGVRKFELDLQFDIDTGILMARHLETIDPLSNCPRFVDCLTQLQTWSAAHPKHHPLVVMMELRIPFDEATVEERVYGTIESQILSVWPKDRVITPDEVQGGWPSLREAILGEGWPTLGQLRGRILFFLSEGGDFERTYTHGGVSLAGRLMFVDAEPDLGYAAIIKRDDPDAPDLGDLVRSGFLVRTRADSDIPLALAGGDWDRQRRALASGAHWVSTDFPAPTAEVSYFLQIPGGTPSRCNPLNAPPGCAATDIEDPDILARD